jgi:hypothetical protein
MVDNGPDEASQGRVAVMKGQNGLLRPLAFQTANSLTNFLGTAAFLSFT